MHAGESHARLAMSRLPPLGWSCLPHGTLEPANQWRCSPLPRPHEPPVRQLAQWPDSTRTSLKWQREPTNGIGSTNDNDPPIPTPGNEVSQWYVRRYRSVRRYVRLVVAPLARPDHHLRCLMTNSPPTAHAVRSFESILRMTPTSAERQSGHSPILSALYCGRLVRLAAGQALPSRSFLQLSPGTGEATFHWSATTTTPRCQQHGSYRSCFQPGANLGT